MLQKLKKLNEVLFPKRAVQAVSAGFTLVEMMIVITIIGMIAAFVTMNVSQKLNQARVDSARIQIKGLGTALLDFKRVCGFFPTTEQGLDALVKPPAGRECKNYGPEGFISEKKVPQDPWGNDYIYESDGNKYVLKSLGSDGKPGGEGIDKDISSEDVE